tara:strand:- start:92 stop:421 length:330 start_codon:yes stop_codon:yes gene_type:complete
MSTEKNKNQNGRAGETGAEVIDITPFLPKKRKGKIEEEVDEKLLTSTLSDLITIMELSTDDIAGTLVARYIYEVDLLPDVDSQLLFDELDLRIKAHRELVDQLREHVQQ